jgi:hypothetical protein
VEKRKWLELPGVSSYDWAVRKLPFALALCLFACSDDDEKLLPAPDGGAPDASADASLLDASPDARVIDARVIDASPPDASPPDASPDASLVDASVDASSVLDAGGCQPTVLLQGGADVVAQGWTVSMMAPSNISYMQSSTGLTTSTTTGARTSGMLLLSYPNAVQVPFAIEVVMRVDSVNPHNQLDSAAAILASFNPPFGNGGDRAQMVYLDSTSIGWADDSQSAAATVMDTEAHTYVLSVDEQNIARVSVDGVNKLTRNNFTTNGTIALGDQTNDPNVDAVVQIESVTKLCP